jgi:RNA polymerase sigma factor (sigma-70 family)
LEEAAFIKLLVNRDESAFKILIRDYSEIVYNTTLSIVQNEHDAEDVTQEVFIEIFQSISKFKGEARLTTWIYRIALTKSLEFIRRKKRQKRTGMLQSLFQKNETEPIKEAIHFYHPGVQLENKERSAILFAAIDKLPENQKSAFLLSKIEQLSYAEISEIMQTSVSSVESLLFRAKQNLRKILADYYKEN